MKRIARQQKRATRGAAMMEFCFVALLLCMVMFTVFEMDRMVLVMTALADSARAGVRYAIVHGTDNPTTADTIKTVIKDYASTGALNTANLNFPTLTFGGAPGSKVDITVTYVYDPFTTYFPLTFTLWSKSEGIVTY